MRRNDTTEKRAGRTTENDRYLMALFTLKRRFDAFAVASKSNCFNDTELRLLGEILLAERDGKRLISTQLATRLGITRSAVSQIVNRLEAEGVIKRVSDKVDRKIAYVVITEETLSTYQKEIKEAKSFIGKIVKEYGTEKFATLCDLMGEFFDVIEKEKDAD